MRLLMRVISIGILASCSGCVVDSSFADEIRPQSTTDVGKPARPLLVDMGARRGDMRSVGPNKFGRPLQVEPYVPEPQHEEMEAPIFVPGPDKFGPPVPLHSSSGMTRPSSGNKHHSAPSRGLTKSRHAASSDKEQLPQ